MIGRRIAPMYPDPIGVLNAQYQAGQRGGVSAPPMTATTPMPPENKQINPLSIGILGFEANRAGLFKDAGREKFLNDVIDPMLATADGNYAAEIAAQANFNKGLGLSQGGGEVYSGLNVPVESFALDSAPWTAGLPSAVPAEALMMPEAMLGSAEVVSGVAPTLAAPVFDAATGVPVYGSLAEAGAATGLTAEGGLLAGAGALGPVGLGLFGIGALGKVFDWW